MALNPANEKFFQANTTSGQIADHCAGPTGIFDLPFFTILFGAIDQTGIAYQLYSADPGIGRPDQADRSSAERI